MLFLTSISLNKSFLVNLTFASIISLSTDESVLSTNDVS